MGKPSVHEQVRKPTEVTLCIQRQSLKPGLAYDVKALVGALSPEQVEKLGFLPLGKHPEPIYPGQMIVVDPAIEREHEAIERHKKQRMEEATRGTRFKKPEEYHTAVAEAQEG